MMVSEQRIIETTPVCFAFSFFLTFEIKAIKRFFGAGSPLKSWIILNVASVLILLILGFHKVS